MDDGRRVTVSAKLSEPVAALIDARRGPQSRSAWLAEAAEFRLGMKPVPVSGRPVSRIIVDERMPPGTAALVSPQPDGPPGTAVIVNVGSEHARPYPCCKHCHRSCGGEGHESPCGKCPKAKGSA